MRWSAASLFTVTLEWKALPNILARSALLAASVLLIFGLPASFAWILTVEGLS